MVKKNNNSPAKETEKERTFLLRRIRELEEEVRERAKALVTHPDIPESFKESKNIQELLK